MEKKNLLTPLDVKQMVSGTPHMSLKQGKMISDFIQQHSIKNVLELGFRHGVSTCYMAAALDKNDGGSIVTVDLESARQAKPNIEELLKRVGKLDKVSIYYEPTSYTWRLMKLLEQNSEPCFDFCYLDGAHSWFVDGFAFFLVDRLLKRNGWIIFDDINWSYEKSPSLKNTDWVKSMPEDERKTSQVLKVFELLVKTHPCYGNFDIKEDWGFAQKIKNGIKSDDIVSQKTRTSKQALEIIKAAITQRKPFSFIRIGDGEATILGYNRDISRKQVDNMTKLWWGQELAKDESIQSLRTELLKSVNYADMLGIFDPVLDSKHLLMGSQFILSEKMVRKYCDLKSINSFVSASDHLDWHDQNLIANLVDGQEIMTLITCRDIASKVADKFSVKTVIWLPIPAEAKYAGWQEVGYLHYPNRMKEILSQIQPLFKGHLFLVGAGILGKIYCRVIKERGGIALDLGSVFDNWAGHTKRPSVKRHRIGV